MIVTEKHDRPTANCQGTKRREQIKVQIEQAMLNFSSTLHPSVIVVGGREKNNQKRQELKTKGKRGRAQTMMHCVLHYSTERNKHYFFYLSLPSLFSCSQPPPSLLSFLAYPDGQNIMVPRLFG